MADSSYQDRLQYALDNAPPSSGFMGFAKPVLWAMGAPTGGPSLDEYFYMQAIRRGQNPAEVLPWLNGSASSATKPPAAPDDKKYKGLAPWYVDWLKTSGQYGGVAPKVQGLL